MTGLLVSEGSLSFMCSLKFNCINKLAYIITNAACILLADCDVLWLQMLMNAKLTMEDALSYVSTPMDHIIVSVG